MIPGPFFDRSTVLNMTSAGLRQAQRALDAFLIETYDEVHTHSEAELARVMTAEWVRRHRASLRPLLTWALVIFLAGIALGALLSTSYRSFTVEGSAARAGEWSIPEAEPIGMGPGASLGGATPSRSARSTEPARANSHADDTPAAESETAMAPQPSVLTTHGPREDPPTAVVLGYEVEPILRAAALEFGIDADELVTLAMCESSLRADAVGRAQEIGLFQWRPRTWESNAPRLGYTILDITDPVAQARLTALVLREDGGWRWTCAR